MVRAFTLLLAAPAFAAPMPELQAQLDRMAAAFPGRLGVGVLDLDSGATAAVRGQEPAPMASVFKLPTAVAVLRRAQEQGLPLSTLVHAGFDERAPDWSPLAPRIPPEGLDVSLDELLDLMVADSDNTAADVLLRWLGSPVEVTRTLGRLGLNGIRVDRSERSMAYALGGATEPPVPEPLDALLARIQAVPASRKALALRSYSRDPRDQASPEALVRLLSELDAGRLLDAAHTRRLMEILRGARTGKRRLAAGLPASVTLAHKTGTLPSRGGFSAGINDVGIVDGDGRRLAIAVLVTDAHAPGERCEDLIADVARAVWSASPRPADAGAR